jgi:8-amino-7-oxononanoate synthase
MQLAAMQQALAEREAKALRRSTRALGAVAGRLLQVNGRQYLNFSGNDYLGLASEPKVQQALCDAISQYGVGSTGSPLVTGFHAPHQALSAELCEWLGVERVLLFSSGFAANQSMLECLASAGDQLLLDKLCHASLISAAQQHPSQAKWPLRRFAHNDLSSLQQLLQKTTAASHQLVVTEGVFSMDGDSPDLSAMLALCQQHQAALLLDDAHGLGVLGPEGRGSAAAQGVAASELFCTMANFGKALGASGAFLAGSQPVMDYLEQFAKHYIYSTALPPALCAAVHCAIRLVRTEQWRRDKLQSNIRLFRQLAQHADLPVLLPTTGRDKLTDRVTESTEHSAIQLVMLGEASRALALSQALQQQGVWLTAIRPPTVPPNSARLRITLSASHQPDDIRFLINSLRQYF